MVTQAKKNVTFFQHCVKFFSKKCNYFRSAGSLAVFYMRALLAAVLRRHDRIYVEALWNFSVVPLFSFYELDWIHSSDIGRWKNFWILLATLFLNLYLQQLEMRKSNRTKFFHVIKFKKHLENKFERPLEKTYVAKTSVKISFRKNCSSGKQLFYRRKPIGIYRLVSETSFEKTRSSFSEESFKFFVIFRMKKL